MANKVRDFVVNSLKQFNEYLQQNILPSYSNKQSDWNTNSSSDESYIKNKPTIPPEVTESTVASWGFTKNTGSLTIETDPVFSASAAHSISANDITNWNNKVSNVQGNWNTTNPSDESYIKNKPAIPSIEGLATETYVIDKISSQSYVTSSQLSSQGYLTSFTESDPVFRNSAASVITAQNILDWNAKVSNVQADWNEDDNTEESYINNKPYIENSYFLVVDSYTAGNSTSSARISTKWDVSSTYITDLYDGLQITLRTPTSSNSVSVSTAGAVLSINNGDYKPVVYGLNTTIGSRYPAGNTFILTYNASQEAGAYLTKKTKTTIIGCWQLTDYSTTDTDIYVRQYKTGNLTTASNEENAYSLLLTYSLTNTDNYRAGSTRYNPSYTLNPFTGELKVGQLNALDGILSYNTYSLNIPETNGTIAVEEDILDIIKDNEFVTATVLNEHDNRLIDLETAGYLTEVPNTYPTYAAISSMGYLTSFTEIDPTVPTYIKNITEDNISSWNSRALSYYLYADGTKNLEVIKHLVFDLPRRNYSIVLDGLYYIQPTGQVSGSSFGNNTGWAPIIRVGIYENTSIIDLYFYTIFDKDSNNNIANNNWSISLYKTDRLTKANIESMTSIPYTLNSNSIFAFKSDLPPTITESTVAEWGFTKNTGTLTEETDPTVPSYIKNITENNISDWNDKVSKLELSGLGYITQASLDSNSYAGYAYVYAAYSYLITSITDNELVISTALNNHESRIDTLENAGYLTSFTETDPTVPTYVKNITETNISNWNNKVSNVQGNWNTTNPSDESYIKNKPTIPSIEGLATETYVTTKVAALVDSAPGTLDTLNELATALGNDPNFATSTATALGNRVTKNELAGLGYVTQTSLSSNSYAGYSYVYAAYSYVLNTIYDNEFVTATVLNYHNDRLDSLENAGYITSFSESDPIFAASPAHGITSTDITNWNNKVSNVRGDWNESDSTSNAYILNKPELIWERGKDGNGISYIGSAQVIGSNSFSYASYAIAEGFLSYAYGFASHAEGGGFRKDIYDLGNNDTITIFSYLNGSYTFGDSSHGEGIETITYGTASHAEGNGSISYGESSHAEGGGIVEFKYYEGATEIIIPRMYKGSYTIGIGSHGEGFETYTYGNASHAEGSGTYTYNTAEHAQGQYNISRKESDTFGDASNTTFSHGIGTGDSNRKNALEIMENGNAYLINVGNYNGTNVASANTIQKTINDLITDRAKIFYGVCSSNADATAKIVTCDSFTSADLVSGALIMVKFAATNTGAVGSLTLNVNGTGALAIKKLYNAGISNLTAAGELRSGSTYLFQYNGNYWVCMTLDYNSTYSSMTVAEYEAGTGTTARIITPARLKGAITYWMVQNQIDWEESDSTLPSYIANKPDIVWEHGKDSSDNVYIYSAQIIGSGSFAYNTYAVAFGSETIANGAYSTALGYNTIASETYSTATGYYTYAEGIAAFTEGYNTHAIGIASHSEGRLTSAYGKFSHAEGQYSISIAQASHAEGYKSYAYGAVSHAEGYSSYTFDQAAHAEGFNTYAYKLASHAEGYNTYAYGVNSHAEGGFTSAIGTDSHSEGEYTYAIGDTSHAEGQYTYAYGFASHAEGIYSYALGNFSHAEGIYSYAIGKSSHASGYNSFAIGAYSFATGYNSISYGAYSFAEGQSTYAYGQASHTEGQYTYTKGIGSHTEGYNTYTGGVFTENTLTESTNYDAGTFAHAEGNATIAIGPFSHAEGRKTFASGFQSHAEGIESQATGLSSHAEGNNTTASGNFGSHSEGIATNAIGFSSHAEGNDTKAIGIQSHAEGESTTAYGNNSHAEGNYAYTISFNSHAEGQYTYTYNVTEHAQGRYNKSTKTSDTFGNAGNTTFSHGIGTSASNRKNAFEVMENGNAYLINVGNYNGTNVASATPIQTIINAKTVGQNSSTANSTYNILLKYSANNTNETNTVNYSSKLNYNPSTGMLSNTGDIRVGSGNLYIGSASESQCHQEYDATNKCLKFIFD